MPFAIDAYPSLARIDVTNTLRVGLVNNMPDAALQASETQFSCLLEAAAGDLSVRLRLSYLPEVSRAGASRERLQQRYWPIDEMLAEGLDALIVTGTEPIAPSLADELYWQRFTQLVDWAQAHTYASIWSCLAAHAAALHLDGIPRRRLEQKCCGIFAHSILGRHPLMNGLIAPLYTPHSRWNELEPQALRDAGYVLLSTSPEAGASVFCRQGRSMMIFFQGHPEYDSATLLREYRRDTERFLNAQQGHYPRVPDGYLSAEATAVLDAYQQKALTAHAAERAEFPYETVLCGVRNTWREAAIKIYSNWLASIATARMPVRARASGAMV